MRKKLWASRFLMRPTEVLEVFESSKKKFMLNSLGISGIGGWEG